MFTLQSALILLGPLPAATLLCVVCLKGILLFASPVAVGLLQSVCVCECRREGTGQCETIGTRHENSPCTYKHGHHNIPLFTLQSALILLAPLPAATLLRVVRLKGILLFASPVAAGLLQSLSVCEWEEGGVRAELVM